jgi:hypothetical protein
MIDEQSMLSSIILAVTERNVRECVFKGQNSKEIWGGVPVVLLFGDNYQLFPVIDEGAIQGYSRMNDKGATNTNHKNDIITTSMPAWNLFIHTNNVRNSICP